MKNDSPNMTEKMNRLEKALEFSRMSLPSYHNVEWLCSELRAAWNKLQNLDDRATILDCENINLKAEVVRLKPFEDAAEKFCAKSAELLEATPWNAPHEFCKVHGVINKGHCTRCNEFREMVFETKDGMRITVIAREVKK